MDWLKQLIKKNPFVALLLPTGLSGFSFIGNLFTALSDGQIDGNELHQLMSSADGLQTLLLMIVMIALKNEKKK